MVQTEIKLFKHALGLNHCGYTSKHYAQLRITAIRALVNKKKRYPSAFFKKRFARSFSNDLRRLTRTCVLIV